MTVTKHFTASAIVRRDGRVLLLWHNKLGMWLYPGGHVEENETPDESVLREVKEETGLTVAFDAAADNRFATETVAGLHTPAIVFDEQIGAGDGMHRHIDLVYLCHPVGEAAVTLAEDEVGQFGWFGKAELADLDMPENLRKYLDSIM
ncbi:MAG: NUDIX domain-containing protein [Planctomycetes bacterium]|nr:NUDIX domain-containing protein [Planctomycetota bacterium]